MRDIGNNSNIELIQYSSFYQTTPIGYTAQSDFINAVCEIKTIISASMLLQELQQIENQHHRVRNFKNGPRTLDLDLIDFDHQIIHTENLTIPHPRAHERGFVMIPFAEILPNYRFKNNCTVCEWSQQLDPKGVQRLNIDIT